MEVLLSSFGAFVVLQSLILLIWKSDPRTVDVPRVLKQGIPVGMLTFTTFQVIIVLTAAIVFLGALLFMRRSKVGKAIRAMENDEAGALMVGIPTQKVRIAAFFIGSLVVALASVLTVLDKGLEPTIGVNALLVAVIAMIVGGVGSLPGAALAGLLLGVVENLGIWKISSEWKSAITFGVLFLFIIFRPRGLFGHRTARYEGDA
jgi:branched-chain amino acid transport system permease protein